MKLSNRALAVLGIVILIISVSYAYSEYRQKARIAAQRELETYAKAISTPSSDGGEIVVTKVQPRIAALVSGTISAEEFRIDAAGWKAGLEQVKRDFEAAPSGALTREASQLYQESLDLYLEAIEQLVNSLPPPGPDIRQALAPGISTAKKADRTFDHASRLLGDQFRRHGLEPLHPAT